jgi:hypothetical protein
VKTGLNVLREVARFACESLFVTRKRAKADLITCIRIDQ